MPLSTGMVERQMYLGAEINALLVGPWPSDEMERRCGLLRADLDRFVQGGLIPVSKVPLSGGKNAYMRQLFRWQDEVWEIKSRDPKPSIRVLGRFADTNVFIALNWRYRADLGGPSSREWRDAIVDCKTRWKNLFPAYEPKSPGDQDVYPTAYISSNTYLL